MESRFAFHRKKYVKDYFWGNCLYLNNLDLFSDEGMTVGIFPTREQAVVWSGYERGRESVAWRDETKALKETKGTKGSVALIQYIFVSSYSDASGNRP